MLTYMLCIKRKLPKYLAFAICRYAGLEYTVGPEIVAGQQNVWQCACAQDNPNLACYYKDLRTPIKYNATKVLQNLTFDINEAFLISCELGNPNMIYYFMRRGANCWDEALERVVVYGHYEYITMLLRRGAVITPQTKVSSKGSAIMCQLLGLSKLNKIK